MRQRIVNGVINTITENDHNFYALDSNINFFSSRIIQEIGIDNGVSYGGYKDCVIKSVKKTLVGKSDREPGYFADGTKAEDMMYGDAPKISASIKKDPMFLHSDATLQKYLNQLMRSLSTFSMETVALGMADRFGKGLGGTYKSDTLNRVIANNPAIIKFHNEFLKDLKSALSSASYDASRISEIEMGRLNFSSLLDKITGLGITIHQVWSIKAELTNYTYNECTKVWKGQLVYTFYDHFGLDWNDIILHGNARIPQYQTGNCFKAWYILQHYRKAKPFITEFSKTVNVFGIANKS